MSAHHIKFLVLLLLSLINSFVFGCIVREREALLKLKQGLIDEEGILSSWGSEDDKKECCSWKGVLCSNTTGHVISLQLNELKGEIGSSLLELSRVTSLDLSSNYFNGNIIPEFIGSMTNLEDLDLSSSGFNGTIPHQIGNLTNLTHLDLSGNQLNGSIPDSFRKLISLEILDLSSNMLEGRIPNFFGNFRLISLHLSSNRLSGSLPLSLGNLTKLVLLDVSANLLNGTISEAHFLKLHSLLILDLSFNSFEMQISPEWNPPFQLDSVILTFCKMGPRFPAWVQSQRILEVLDLSHTAISDEVPRWVWRLFTTKSAYLNLSYNEIRGTIPDISSISTRIIDITSNNFSGPIPMFHPNTSIVQISENNFNGPISSICLNEEYQYLTFFDASSNQFDGVLPNCWDRLVKLRILNLGNNFFSGEIPQSLGFLYTLETLHLNDNYLSGDLPSTLSNCTLLRLINVHGNKLSGNIPKWIGANFTFLTYMIFRDNEFSGNIPHELCNVTGIQLLDLSRNNISGKIPRCFDQFSTLVEKNVKSNSRIHIPLYGIFSTFVLKHFLRYFADYTLVQWKGQESEYQNILGFLTFIDLSSNKLVGSIPGELSLLHGLASLNLSRNFLTGNIDPNIGQMETLQSLDLSRNQLDGVIPMGLARLHYLQVLDLSHNNLSGAIPKSTQLQSFNASVYAGNTQLCGPPLEPCPGDGTFPSTKKPGGHGDSDEKENGFMNLSFAQDLGISMTFGFIFGFWGVFGPLLLRKSWRIAHFRFFDNVGDWLYVKTILFIAKFRKR